MILALPLLLLCAQGKAAPEKNPMDGVIREFMKTRAAELEQEFLPGVKSAADFETARPALRGQYLHMLGLWPLPEKTPLEAAVTGRIEGPGYVIEKLHYQSRPGLYVTANLYLPASGKGPHPAIVYQCGHSNMKRDGNKSAYQDHGIWFATHGYVCLVTDTLQLGEIAAIHHGTYRHQRWNWHSTGYTPAGVECWNAVRGIDYLQSRPEVDPGRIGATGISGGGAATFWISAADERVKVSVPVSGMADLGFYVGEDGVNGHCDCMFLYNTFRWNWTMIAALVCPRPLLFTNSDNDGIFPMSANDRVINRLERLYARFGAGDRVDAMVSIGGHAYRTDLRRAVFEFFNRHLKGDASPVTDADAGRKPDGKPWIDPPALRVFPEDKDIPRGELNTKIDESFVPLAKPGLPAAENFEAWRKGLLDELRRVSFGAWPAGHPRAAGTGRPEALVVELEEPSERLPAWAKALAPESAAVINPQGSATRAWTRKNPPNTVERSMALLGMTADSGRVWDILAHVRAHPGRWSLYGKGAGGILAAYAALYEPSIESVTIVDPPASHREGPHFLNVLRVLDIPEALGCLAPRPLTLIGAGDPAFDRTATLFKLAGAEARFERKP